ncbi:flagellar filament capping protein FliD [Paralcaligenes ginsengisoli]
MANVSSLGVGSGLPLDTLLTNLRNSENTALVAIQTQQSGVQSRISAYGQLKNTVTTLQGTIAALSSNDTYGALKTSVSSSAFTASATSQAIPGQYSIQVDTLATAQTLIGAGQASQTAANGTGGQVTITLADGTSKVLDMTGKDTSLNGLVSAINSDSTLGVQATLINDGSGTPYHLLLTAAKTGTTASVTSISVSPDNTALQSVVGFGGSSPALTATAATNASLRINGIAISSQSNQVANAIQGVTLNLNTTTTAPSNLSITSDNSAVSAAVNAFVTAYNSLQTTLQSLTAFDTTAKTSSALTGDSVARSIQNQVRNVMNVVSSTGTVRTLSQLGISTNKDGTLAIDSTKLAAAVNSNPDDVKNLLSGTNGVAQTLTTVTNNILGTNGLLSTATDSANSISSDLQKQYDDTSARIDAVMATYQTQFTNLDTMVAQMNSVSSYLTQQLSSLSISQSSTKK